MPGQREHPLAVDLAEPVGEARQLVGRCFVGDEAAAGVEQADLDQLGDGIDQARPAQSLGGDVADHLAGRRRRRVTLTTSMAPSAARMPQRIAPPSKAGPAGAAVETMRSPSPSTISQLVPTSMNSRMPLVAVHPGREHPGHDVAADVGAERRQHDGASARVDVDAEVAGEQLGEGRAST